MSRSRRKFLESVAVGAGVMVSSLSEGGPSLVADEPKNAMSRGPAGGAKEASSLAQKFFAQAVGFEESVVYRPAQRPGFASRVAPWKGSDGALLMSFIEKRRLPNPNYRPVPLDFYEALTFPIKYQASFLIVPEVVTESVVMRSHDQGRTWKEVGRCVTDCIQNFAYLSLPDGAMLRGSHNVYLAYYPQERVISSIQKSTDLGNTWKEFSIVAEDYVLYPYRLMALSDGTLVFLGEYADAFGPGRRTPTRGTAPTNVRTQQQSAFFYSYDWGATWQGPVLVFPGVIAPEPDWVELPSGDLLLINSDVQHGPNTRQIIRRQGKHFVPQPVFDITGGPVPETVVITQEGLLVGARRNAAYSCSKDQGDTWYPLGGSPNSLYQPRIIQLDDGRFCNFFHCCGDNIFGEVDEYVGRHAFRLEEHLPAPTTLVITRDKNPARPQYLNAFTATLKAGDKPLPAKEIKFRVRAASRHRKSYKTEEFVGLTDAQGRARIALPEFDKCIDVHRDYSVQAEFAPSVTETTLASARSAKYGCYRMTPSAQKKNTYAFYVAGGRLFVEKDMLEKFPEIERLVKVFGLQSSFAQAELASELKLDKERSKLFIDMLLRHNVMRAGKDGAYTWNEVEVTEVRPIVVEDDFVS